MRVAELSSRSGTSIASIKFYLREGLLPPGQATAPNQADYGDAHLHRLHLVRALIDVGKLSVSAAREVLAAADARDLATHFLLGAAHCALDRPTRRDPDDPVWRAARDEILSLVRQRGWHVPDEAPGIDHAADAVAAFRALGQDDLVALIETYADAVERIASFEVDAIIARGEPARMVEGVVTGTILGEALLNALRRLAQEDASARRLLTAAQLGSGNG